MKTPTTIYSCSNCDAQAPKWQGRCSQCGAWGTLTQTTASPAAGHVAAVPAGKVVAFSDITVSDHPRHTTGIEELDRVLGGGIVRGSLVLLGGEPGIGKSTLVLQLAQSLKAPVLYVSGEESAEQIKDRVTRLGIDTAQLAFLGETNIDTIVATLREQKPALAIVDSIQTVYSPQVGSGPGSVTQVRLCTTALLEVAKKLGVSILIIGHVTKEGEVAGPRTLEHLVDTVLYLEGDRHHAFRILRSVKNRFGSTFEVGIFDMQGAGLVEVKDPTSIFLSQRLPDATGSVITPALEGSRIFLLEIQALVSPTSFGYPQRKAYGLDLNRAQLLIAVLNRRLGLNLGAADIHLNLIGGMKLSEPAADLPIALAMVSAAQDITFPADTVAFGEIGLGGEIRPVRAMDKRVQEAAKLGFKRALLPASRDLKTPKGMTLLPVRTLGEAAKMVKQDSKIAR